MITKSGQDPVLWRTPVPLLQLGRQPPHALRVGADLAQVAHLALPPILSDGHGVPQLGGVQPDENFPILFHGSSSCAEDRPAPAGNPRHRAV